MFKTSLLLLVLLQFPVQAFSTELPPSPLREFDQRSSSILSDGLNEVKRGSAQERRRPYNRIDFSNLPTWTYEQLMETFVFIRDLRFVSSEDKPDFLRRLSWLYPDDGCSTRAGFMSFLLTQHIGLPQPMRLFIFGDLRVATEQHPRGQVSWWYHTALVLRVENEIYVIDPSLSFKRPLKIEEWIALQADTSENVELSLCLSGAYSPRSLCDRQQLESEGTLLSHQEIYLKPEWTRQLELGRNPEQVLGDEPPWIEGLKFLTNRLYH
jgi:hypothetical protein